MRFGSDVPKNDLHDPIGGIKVVYPQGAGSEASLNAPKGIGWAHCISIGTGAFQTLLVVDELGKICATGQANGMWNSWNYFATATPPKSFTVKPTVNITAGTITFSRDQFNKIWLHFGLAIGPLAIQDGTIIAILPEGFCPSGLIDLPIVVARPDQHAGLIEINGKGEIKALYGCSNATSISCNQYFFGA